MGCLSRPFFALAVLAAVFMSGCASDKALPAEPAETIVLPPPFDLALMCPGPAGIERPEGQCVAAISSPTSAFTEPFLAKDPTHKSRYVLGVNEFPPPLRVEELRPGTATLKVRLWVTSDDGATWDDLPMPRITTDPEFALGNYTTGDPTFAFSREGVLHVAGMVANNALGFIGSNVVGIFHAETPDLGKTWTQELLELSAGPDRPWVNVDDSGNVVVAWQSLAVEGDHSAIRYRLAGKTWSETVQIPDCVQVAKPVMANGQVWIVCRHTIWEPKAEMRFTVLELNLANGSLVEKHRGPHEFHVFPRLAHAEDGRLVVALPVAGDLENKILLTQSTDGGSTWTNLTDIVAGIPEARDFDRPDLGWIDFGPDGRLHLIIAGGGQRRLNAEHQLQPPPGPYAYASLNAGFGVDSSTLLYAGLPESPTELPPHPGMLAYCCNDYQGLAFGDDAGLVAWTRDGVIDIAALRRT